VRTDLTEGSGPPQVALRGAALTCFPNETSEAALRDPANKHFAQRFVISVTEEVLPSRPSSIPSSVSHCAWHGSVSVLFFCFWDVCELFGDVYGGCFVSEVGRAFFLLFRLRARVRIVSLVAVSQLPPFPSLTCCFFVSFQA